MNHVVWRDVADGFVESLVVVVLHISYALAKRGWCVRTLIEAIGIAVVGLPVVVGIAISGARQFYGPLGPLPGPALAGSVVEEAVQDWSPVDAIKAAS